MELALRRLEGVDKISINIPKQTFQVTFKPGNSFDPAGIRDAVAKANVAVVRFTITARGQVQGQGAKRSFVAGKDRFLLKDSTNVPANGVLAIQGIVNDSTSPIELQIKEFKPAGP